MYAAPLCDRGICSIRGGVVGTLHVRKGDVGGIFFLSVFAGGLAGWGIG